MVVCGGPLALRRQQLVVVDYQHVDQAPLPVGYLRQVIGHRAVGRARLPLARSVAEPAAAKPIAVSSPYSAFGDRTCQHQPTQPNPNFCYLGRFSNNIADRPEYKLSSNSRGFLGEHGGTRTLD